jgi:hypothetical protein
MGCANVMMIKMECGDMYLWILTIRRPNLPRRPRKITRGDMPGRELNIVLNASFNSFFSPDNELNL